MVGEQVSGLAGHFQYLTQTILGAYDKCSLKTDHFVIQLQFSDTGVSSIISSKCDIGPGSHLFCN